MLQHMVFFFYVAQDSLDDVSREAQCCRGDVMSRMEIGAWWGMRHDGDMVCIVLCALGAD